MPSPPPGPVFHLQALLFLLTPTTLAGIRWRPSRHRGRQAGGLKGTEVPLAMRDGMGKSAEVPAAMLKNADGVPTVVWAFLPLTKLCILRGSKLLMMLEIMTASIPCFPALNSTQEQRVNYGQPEVSTSLGGTCTRVRSMPPTPAPASATRWRSWPIASSR